MAGSVELPLGVNLFHCYNNWVFSTCKSGVIATLFLSIFCSPIQAWGEGSGQKWVRYMEGAVAKVTKKKAGKFGVYAKRLSDGSWFGHYHKDTFYYASTIKLFVLIEAIRQRDRGRFSFKEKVKVKRSDFRDWSGISKWIKPGAKVSYEYLLDQMITYSDNLATDILLRKLGVDNVNRTMKHLFRGTYHDVTSMLTVRQEIFGRLDPAGQKLDGYDYFKIRRRPGVGRWLRGFEKKIRTKKKYKNRDWIRATNEFYKTKLNSGSILNYAQLLERIVKADGFTKKQSNEVLERLRKVQTGWRRVRRGLPKGYKFAHKTGSQYRRLCDLGVVGKGKRHQYIVAVCAKNFWNMRQAEKVVARISKELRRSGFYKKP